MCIPDIYAYIYIHDIYIYIYIYLYIGMYIHVYICYPDSPKVPRRCPGPPTEAMFQYALRFNQPLSTWTLGTFNRTSWVL